MYKHSFIHLRMLACVSCTCMHGSGLCVWVSRLMHCCPLVWIRIEFIHGIQYILSLNNILLVLCTGNPMCLPHGLHRELHMYTTCHTYLKTLTHTICYAVYFQLHTTIYTHILQYTHAYTTIYTHFLPSEPIFTYLHEYALMCMCALLRLIYLHSRWCIWNFHEKNNNFRWTSKNLMWCTFFTSTGNFFSKSGDAFTLHLLGNFSKSGGALILHLLGYFFSKKK